MLKPKPLKRDPKKSKKLPWLKLKLKPIESKPSMKLTRREDKKPPKLNKLLKMLPMLLLKKPLMRLRKPEKLKKISNLPT